VILICSEKGKEKSEEKKNELENLILYLHRLTLMIDSPFPVAEAAATLLSAYPPQPAIGESPTRPGWTAVRPPVEVAHATLPWLSTATAPTFDINGKYLYSAFHNVSMCFTIFFAINVSLAHRSLC
jgi:hypothetical protein